MVMGGGAYSNVHACMHESHRQEEISSIGGRSALSSTSSNPNSSSVLCSVQSPEKFDLSPGRRWWLQAGWGERLGPLAQHSVQGDTATGWHAPSAFASPYDYRRSPASPAPCPGTFAGTPDGGAHTRETISRRGSGFRGGVEDLLLHSLDRVGYGYVMSTSVDAVAHSVVGSHYWH